MISLFLRGLVLGISIAAPVGPIGLLCIRRSLSYGTITGLLSGLGAATADGVYGAIAAFGLAFISNFLTNQARWLGIIGGLFLCYLGITTFLSKPADKTTEISRTGLAGAYLSTLGLTLTNPATILSFVLLFAGFAPTGLDYGQAVVMVGGVFLGSALWWLILSSGVSRLRHWLTPGRLVWVNRVFGVLITGFGIVALSWRG
ncbi:putative threonine efflux protein [Leptolyngbya sp. PCC 7375]|nr:putative threonine efflux protein [Leptolyngbya sp. PCC 7375]